MNNKSSKLSADQVDARQNITVISNKAQFSLSPLKTSIIRGFVLGAASAAASIGADPALADQCHAGKYTASSGVDNVSDRTQQNTTTTTISLSQNSVIDWESFTVASGDIVNYNFSYKNGVVVNYIDPGQVPSQINGAINSYYQLSGQTSGNLFFIAPGGLIIGPHAAITAGGLVLSGLDYSVNKKGNGNISDPSNTFTLFENTESKNYARTVEIDGGASINTLSGGLHIVGNGIYIARGASLTSTGGDINIGAVSNATFDFSKSASTPSVAFSGYLTAPTLVNGARAIVDVAGTLSGNSVKIDAYAQDASQTSQLMNIGGIINAGVNAPVGSITLDAESSVATSANDLTLNGSKLTASGTASQISIINNSGSVSGQSATISAANLAVLASSKLNTDSIDLEGLSGKMTVAASASNGIILGSTGGTLTVGSGLTLNTDANVVKGSLSGIGVSAGLAGIQLTADALSISDAVDAGAGDVALIANKGGISGAGVITANTLTATATGANFNLSGDNQVNNLGDLSANAIAFTNAAASGLKLTGDIAASNGSVALTVKQGDLTEGALASITASSLTGEVDAGKADLETRISVNNLAGFTALNGLKLSNSGGSNLTVSGTIQSAQGDVSISTDQALLVGAGSTLGGNNITLSAYNGNSANNHSGKADIQFLGSASNSISLTAASTTGSTVELDGSVSVAGGLSITQQGSDFSIAQDLTTGGALSIDVGTHDINIASGAKVNTTGANAIFNANQLQLDGSLTAGVVELHLGTGGIAQGAASQLNATSLKGNSAGDVLLTGTNNIASISGFDATGKAFTLNDATGASNTLTLSGAVTGDYVSLSNDGSIAGSGGVTAAHTLSLTSTSGSLSLSNLAMGDGAMVDGTLTAVAAKDITLDTGTTDFVVGSGGVASTSGNVSLSGANLSFNDNVSTGSGKTLTLTTVGDVTQADGTVVTAGVLASGAKTAHSVALSGNNAIGGLAGFATTNGFTLNTTEALTVSGNVTSALGDTSLTSAHALTVGSSSADVSITGKNISLAGSQISFAGASKTVHLDANTVKDQNAGKVSLSGPFTVAGGLEITSQAGFDITQDITTGGALSINTGANALAINQGTTVDATGHAVTFTASGLTVLGTLKSGALDLELGAGGVTESSPTESGSINASSLTGNSLGDVELTGTNAIAAVGTFTAGKAFTLIDATGSANTLSVTGVISGGDVSLGNDGSIITSGAGGIQSSTLSLNSTGGALNLSNLVVGTDLTANAASDITLNAGKNDLVVGSGGVNSAAGNVSLSGNNLTFNDDLNTGTGKTLTLNATGNVAQADGTVINAGTLQGGPQTANAVNLAGANVIDTLAGFNSANGFVINSTNALTVSGAVNNQHGVTAITSTSGLTVNSNVSGGSVELNSGGSSIMFGGSGVTLTANSGSVKLDQAADSAGALTINSTAGFSLLGDLTTHGTLAIDAGSGALDDGGFNITTNNNAASLAGNSIALAGALDVGSQQLSLNAGSGGVTHTAGSITAGSLTGSSTGNVVLTGADQINQIAGFNAHGNDFTLTDHVAALSIDNGQLQGGAVSLTNSAGISGQGGIVATSLVLAADSGAIDLQNLNAGSVTATALNEVSLAAGGNAALTIDAKGVNSTGLGVVTLSGYSIAIDGIVGGNNPLQTVTLNAGKGGVSETALVGIQTNTLTGSSAGQVNLLGNNAVNTLSNFTLGGDFTLSSTAQNLLVDGLSAAGHTVTLQAGALSQTGQVLAAGTLNATATLGTVDFGNLQVDNVTASAVGDINLLDAGKTLTVDGGGVVSQSGLVNIEAGGLNGAGAVQGSTLTLIADTADINLSGNVQGASAQFTANHGAITASGLNVDSVSATAQNGVTLSNAKDLSVAGISSGGTIALTANGALTQTGEISGQALNARATDINLGQLKVATVSANASAGNVTLVEEAGQSLAVGSAGISASNNVTVTADALVLNQAVTAANALSLQSSVGDITGTGAVSATSLTLNSAGAVALNGTGNMISQLTSATAVNGINLNDNESLTIAGVVDGGKGYLDSPANTQPIGTTISVLGNGNQLSVNSDVNGGFITLTAATINVDNSLAVLRAENPDGVVTLNGLVNALNGLSIYSPGGYIMGGDININGSLLIDVGSSLFSDVGADANHTIWNIYTQGHNVTLSGGELNIAGLIDTTGVDANNAVIKGVVDLSTNITNGASGNLTDHGVIKAASLTSSQGVGGTAILDGANELDQLGAFNAAKGFTLNNATNLAVVGTVNGGNGYDSVTGNAYGTTISSDHTLMVSSEIDGGFIALAGVDQVHFGQAGATLTAVNADGKVSLTGPTVADGSLSITSPGGFSLQGDIQTNGTFTLDVKNSAFTDTTNGVQYNIATNGGDANISAGSMNLSGLLDTHSAQGMGNVALTSVNGDIVDTGTIIAASLSGTAAGAASFSGVNNQIAQLNGFTATKGFNLQDSTDLAVVAKVDGGSGYDTVTNNAYGTTISSDHTLTVSSEIDGGFIALTGGDQIHFGQAGATLTAVNADGKVSLDGPTIADGSLSITSPGGFNLQGDIQTHGAFTLDVKSSAFTDITNGVQYNIATDGGDASVTAGSMNLSGQIDTRSAQGQGNVSLTANGGDIVDTGAIFANSLTGSALGAASFTGANQIAALNGFTTTKGDFVLNDANNLGGLQVTGAVLVGGNAQLSATSMDLGADLQATDTVTLTTLAGDLIQSAGAITAQTLTGSAFGSAQLTDANHVATLNAFTAGQDLKFNNADDLSLVSMATDTQATAGGNVVIQSAGHLTVNTDLTAASLALSGDQGMEFTQATNLTANAANGIVSLAAAQGEIVGDSSLNVLSPGGFTLNQELTTHGDLTVTSVAGNFAAQGFGVNTNDGNVNIQALGMTADGVINAGAGKVNLVATAGDILQTNGVNVGSIVTSSLSGSANGKVELGGANQVNALDGFTAGGDFTMNNLGGLTIDAALPNSAGIISGGNVALTATGTMSGEGVVIGNALSATTLGTGDIALLTQVNAVTLASAGNADIENTGASLLASGSAAGTQLTIHSTGDVLVADAGLVDQAGLVTLTSDSGSITAGGTGIGQVIGDSLVATAGTALTNQIALSTQVNNLNVNAGGDIAINNTSAALNAIGQAGQRMTINQSGDLSVGDNGLTAATDMVLTSTAGQINGTGVATANTLTATALDALNGNITLNTAVNTLTANAGVAASFSNVSDALTANGAAGTNFSLTQTGALTVGNGGLTATTGDMSLDAASIAVANSVIAGGNALMIGETGSIQGAGLVQAQTLTATAATTDADVSLSNVKAAIISATAGHDIALTNDATSLSLEAQAGNSATVTNTGALVIGANGVHGVAGDVNLSATSIQADQAVSAGQTLTMNASAGSVAGVGLISATNLVANAVGETSDVLLSNVDIRTVTANAGRAITLNGVGDLTVASGGLNAATGAVQVSAGSLNVGGDINGVDTVLLNASTGDISGAGHINTSLLTATAVGNVGLSGLHVDHVNVKAGQSVNVQNDQDLFVDNVAAGANAEVGANGDMVIRTIAAGGNVVIDSLKAGANIAGEQVDHAANITGKEIQFYINSNARLASDADAASSIGHARSGDAVIDIAKVIPGLSMKLLEPNAKVKFNSMTPNEKITVTGNVSVYDYTGLALGNDVLEVNGGGPGGLQNTAQVKPEDVLEQIGKQKQGYDKTADVIVNIQDIDPNRSQHIKDTASPEDAIGLPEDVKQQEKAANQEAQAESSEPKKTLVSRLFGLWSRRG